MKYFWSDKKTAEMLAARDALALFLDFDGTLVPLASEPHRIRVPDAVGPLLAKLSGKKRTTVGVVSGRSLKDLTHYLALPPRIPLAGSHGLEWVIGGNPRMVDMPKGYLAALNDLYLAFILFANVAPGVQVEWKGVSISVHLRGVSGESRPAVRKRVIEMITQVNTGDMFRVIAGKTDVDLRPNIAWTKAEVIRELLYELNVPVATTLFAYIGDDTTDEDVFRAFPSSVTVRVGRSTHSRANYYLRGVPDVLKLLSFLVERRP